MKVIRLGETTKNSRQNFLKVVYKNNIEIYIRLGETTKKGRQKFWEINRYKKLILLVGFREPRWSGHQRPSARHWPKWSNPMQVQYFQWGTDISPTDNCPPDNNNPGQQQPRTTTTPN